MLRCYFKLPQKDIGVPQIAVSSSFCRPVAKFLRYEQALPDKTDTGNKFTERAKGAFISIGGVWEKC